MSTVTARGPIRPQLVEGEAAVSPWGGTGE